MAQNGQFTYVLEEECSPETIAVAAELYHEWVKNSALGDDTGSLPQYQNLNDDDRGNWCAVAIKAAKIAENAIKTKFGL
jgi:hypothetical protein